MATQQLSVGELQPGMYVAKLHISWLRSPFLRHSFLIESQAQIEKLVRAGVKTVEIDLSRGIAPLTPRPLTMSTPESVSTPVSSTQGPKPLAQLNQEYAQAKLAKQQLERAVHSVFSTIAQTGTVNPQQATEAVQEITIVMRTLSQAAIFMALSQNRAEDSSLSQHALNVCTLSLVLGQTFPFNPLELQELATAALLHDIGLLHVPPILLKRAQIPNGLSSAEQQQLYAHPRLGALFLERQGQMERGTMDLIATHHAYGDNSGYPKETQGQSTSDRARILMLVDRYDELMSGFGGLTPMTAHQTFQRLYQEAKQGKLDQRFLSALIAMVGMYPVHSYVRLNTRELAVVTELNTTKLHQPVVTITHQSEATTYPAPFVIDLAHQDETPDARVIEAVLTTPPAGDPSTSAQAA